MPLWVIVELMSFSNMSKLYRSMYISDKERIAKSVGVNNYKVLENHLHCLAVLRNKCAHAARLYNTKFNPPAKLTKQFLRKNQNVKNDSLFAYILVLIDRLPDKETKIRMLDDIEKLFKEYKAEVFEANNGIIEEDKIDGNIPDIDLSLMGFPENYMDLLKKRIKD